VFFALSKLLDVAFDPVWWALAAMLAGLVLRARTPRVAVGSLVGGFAVLLLLSSPVVVDRMMAGLESSALNTYRPEVTYDVVVLLGGVVDVSGSTREQPAYGQNVDRLTRVFELLRQDKAKRVIISGGRLTEGLPTEAAFLQQQLIAWGIAPERIVAESSSMNTHENAVKSAALIRADQAQSVLLVTSAFHMPRAAGCFTAAGVTFDSLPVDYRMRDASRDGSMLPRAEYLGEATRVLRELVGRVVYRVLGYSR
jgi:uncharacterized SAM-binding protein YcdF (DUF218 family)